MWFFSGGSRPDLTGDLWDLSDSVYCLDLLLSLLLEEDEPFDEDEDLDELFLCSMFLFCNSFPMSVSCTLGDNGRLPLYGTVLSIFCDFDPETALSVLRLLDRRCSLLLTGHLSLILTFSFLLSCGIVENNSLEVFCATPGVCGVRSTPIRADEDMLFSFLISEASPRTSWIRLAKGSFFCSI